MSLLVSRKTNRFDSLQVFYRLVNYFLRVFKKLLILNASFGGNFGGFGGAKTFPSKKWPQNHLIHVYRVTLHPCAKIWRRAIFFVPLKLSFSLPGSHTVLWNRISILLSPVTCLLIEMSISSLSVIARASSKYRLKRISLREYHAKEEEFLPKLSKCIMHFIIWWLKWEWEWESVYRGRERGRHKRVRRRAVDRWEA